MYTSVEVQRLGIASIILIVMDLLWIHGNKDMYATLVKLVQKNAFKAKPQFAVVTYAFLILGLMLCLPKNADTIKTFYSANSLLYPFFFGCVVYGVYSFTNMTIFENYSLEIAVKDTLWGGIIFFIAVIFALWLVPIRKKED